MRVRAMRAAAGEFVMTRAPTRDAAAAPRPASSTNNSGADDNAAWCAAIKSLKASWDRESPASTTAYVPVYLGWSRSTAPPSTFLGRRVVNNGTRAFRNASPAGTTPSSVMDQFTAYTLPSRSRGNVVYSSAAAADENMRTFRGVAPRNRTTNFATDFIRKGPPKGCESTGN